MNWYAIIETFIADFSVAVLTALVGAIFLNRYLQKINFSRKLNRLGFENASVNKQSRAEIRQMFKQASTIKMIFVSGIHFLKQNEDYIRSALDRGALVQVLVARPGSNLLKDIENMEYHTFFKGKRIREKDKKINDELLDIIKTFEDTSLQIRFYDTEYRLPFTLAYFPDQSAKAWLTMSLPPYKSTESFVMRGKKEDSSSESMDLHFIEMMETHFDTIWDFGSLDTQTALDDFYAYHTYKELEKKAIEYMGTRTSTSCLIEAAAQHPLRDGQLPDTEFIARLDKAISLYHEKKSLGMDCKIYVPGSIHFHDRCSLSEAGVQYLMDHHIPPVDLYGDQQNQRYAHDQGVYNSTDECYVASCIFKEEDFGSLICVCSPAQLHRKALSYIRFGVFPQFVSVSVPSMYHSFVDEAFYKIPSMLHEKEMNEEMEKQRRHRKLK